MTEYDWDLIWRWNYNHDSKFFSEERKIFTYSPDQIQQNYRELSKDSFCFIIEANNEPIGECSFQNTIPERILKSHPVRRCRCIDLVIGEEKFFAPSYSMDVVRTLTKFGFEDQEADIIFACEVPGYDRNILRIFQKSGYQVYQKITRQAGRKTHYIYDLTLTAEQYYENKEG